MTPGGRTTEPTVSYSQMYADSQTGEKPDVSTALYRILTKHGVNHSKRLAIIRMFSHLENQDEVGLKRILLGMSFHNKTIRAVLNEYTNWAAGTSGPSRQRPAASPSIGGTSGIEFSRFQPGPSTKLLEEEHIIGFVVERTGTSPTLRVELVPGTDSSVLTVLQWHLTRILRAKGEK